MIRCHNCFPHHLPGIFFSSSSKNSDPGLLQSLFISKCSLHKIISLAHFWFSWVLFRKLSSMIFVRKCQQSKCLIRYREQSTYQNLTFIMFKRKISQINCRKDLCQEIIELFVVLVGIFLVIGFNMTLLWLPNRFMVSWSVPGEKNDTFYLHIVCNKEC